MKRTIINPILIILMTTWCWSLTVIAMGTGTFKDTDTHWAKEYINSLTANGAIKGYTDSTFRPENKISRAEFTAILLRAMKNDVGLPKEGKWYANYITEATNRKYILSGEFDSVEKNITRGEIARMIVRAVTEEYPGNMTDYSSQLSDYSKIPAEYKDFALKAYAKGIITGQPGGLFAHASFATRAEATTMIVRLIDAAKRVLPKETVNDDLYMYEFDAKKEAKVETSHPELIQHIKKAIEIMSKEGYADASYNNIHNTVQIRLYPDKEEFQKDKWERKAILLYDIDLEADPRSSVYLPYDVVLYDVNNKIGQSMYRELSMDVFPSAYDIIVKELDNAIKDKNYTNLIEKKYNGREIQCITNRGISAVGFRAILENQ